MASAVMLAAALAPLSAARGDDSVPLASVGAYVDTSGSGRETSALVFASNNGQAGTAVRVQYRPVHSNRAADRLLGTFTFSVNKPVTFSGPPTAKISLEKKDLGPPYIATLRDTTARTTLGSTLPYWYRELTFYGEYATKFKALPKHRYEIGIFSHVSAARVVNFDIVPITFDVPPINGFAATVSLAKTRLPLGWLYAYGEPDVPLGIPGVPLARGEKLAYDAALVVGGLRRFATAPSVTFSIPPSERGHRFAVTTYDAARSSLGWSTPTNVAVDARGLLTVKLPQLTDAFQWRRLDIALISSDQYVRLQRPSLPPRRTISVVGDSVTRLTIIPPSPVGCPLGFGPLPDCQYVDDPALNFPGVLAAVTHDNIVNLGWLGPRALIDAPSGPPLIKLEVPEIPPSSSIVVVEVGHIDLDVAHGDPLTARRAVTLVNAIRKRAPSAHLVFLIDRYITKDHRGSDAWAKTQIGLARSTDAVVDLRPLYPDAMNPGWPDGGHPTPETARKIATLIASAVARWR